MNIFDILPIGDKDNFPPKLSDSVKHRVILGRASLYTCEVVLVPDAKYILSMPGRPTCGCGHSDRQLVYLLNNEGEVLTEVPEGLDVKIIKSVR